MLATTVGKYRIVGQIGRGATGTVYKAIDETLNRDVAIKVLHPDLADGDIVKRFRAEATTLAKLNHPEIAVIYELIRADSDLLMVMEFVRGETLDKLSTRLGPLPPDRVARLLDRVLAGLEHAHRAGIVHRDMKPANVMLTTAGAVKIMDFGIARVRGAEHMTVDGRMMGTPAYMAPEQVLGDAVDGRADLYSVGVMFYRLLTGALPFEAETALAMLQRQIADAPAPLARHRTDLPAWCDGIVQRALAKAPADRFQTAEEFRLALTLEAGIQSLTDLAKMFAVQESEVIAAPSAPAVVETIVEPPLVRRAHGGTIVLRGKDFLGVAAAVVVLATGVGVFAYAALGRPAAPAAEPAALSGVQAQRGASAAADQPEERREPVRRAPARREIARPTAPAPDPSTATAAAPVRPRSSHDEAPLTFEAKALVSSKGRQRERSAYLLLADGAITVTADDDTRALLYSVPYDSVIAITYSKGRHPMWNSPQGPAPVVRAGGTLSRLGISFDRDWVSLRTRTSHQFVNLRFTDVVARKALVALEERTGRTPEFVDERKEDDRGKDDRGEESDRDERQDEN